MTIQSRLTCRLNRLSKRAKIWLAAWHSKRSLQWPRMPSRLGRKRRTSRDLRMWMVQLSRGSGWLRRYLGHPWSTSWSTRCPQLSTAIRWRCARRLIHRFVPKASKTMLQVMALKINRGWHQRLPRKRVNCSKRNGRRLESGRLTILWKWIRWRRIRS